jgi:hypothetical protein
MTKSPAPPRAATHWSLRDMANVSGLSRMTVSRIWRAFGLQPHRTETFKLSNDPLLIEKVRDIVGLYLSPPDHAIVLCVDEKAQIVRAPCYRYVTQRARLGELVDRNARFSRNSGADDRT